MNPKKEDLETLIFCNFVFVDHKDREIRNVIIFDERGEPQQIQSSKYEMEFYRQSDRVHAEDKWGHQFVWDLLNLNKGPKLEIPSKCCTTSADPETMTAIAKEELDRFTKKDKIPFSKLCNVGKSTYITKNLGSTGLEVKIPQAKIKFAPIGIGDASSKNNSSFIIEADRKYLIDLPPNIEDMLENAHLFLEDVNDVVITHAHGDHIGGLQWFLLQKINANQKVNIYTTKEIFEQTLSTIISPWICKQAKSNSIIFKELNTERSYAENNIKIDIRANIHEKGVPTIGFKFSYDGKTLGYSGDCIYSKRAIKQKRKELSDNLKKLLSETVERVLQAGDFIDADEIVPITGRKNWEEYLNKLLANCGEFRYRYEPLITQYYAQKKKLNYAYERLNPAWFACCDLVIHEATDKTGDPVHTNVKDLEKLPKKIKEKMYLVHVPDGFESRYKGSIPILKEGTRYRL